MENTVTKCTVWTFPKGAYPKIGVVEDRGLLLLDTGTEYPNSVENTMDTQWGHKITPPEED